MCSRGRLSMSWTDYCWAEPYIFLTINNVNQTIIPNILNISLVNQSLKFDVLHSFFVGSLDKIGGTSHDQRSNNDCSCLPAKATILALVFICALLFLLLLTFPSLLSLLNFCFGYLLGAIGLASGCEVLPLFVDGCSLFLVHFLQI